MPVGDFTPPPWMRWTDAAGWQPMVCCDPAPHAARGWEVGLIREFTLTWPTIRYMTEADLGIPVY